MSKSESLSGSDEGDDSVNTYSIHRVPLSLSFFKKDVEISKRDFLLLFFILNSLIFLLIGQIGLDLIILESSGFQTDYFALASIVNGALLGLLLSIFTVERIRNPLHLIQFILIISLSATIVQIYLIFLEFHLILDILFFFNVLLITYALMINGKLFLLKTTILERARVWSYLFVFSLVVIAIVFSSLFYNLIIIIPISFIIITIIFLNSKKHKDEIFFYVDKQSMEKERNIDLLKYYFFFFFFSLTVGLATPREGSLEILSSTLGGNLALIFLIIIIFGIMASLLIGMFFDYFVRIGALSYIIFAIAVANYIHSFQLGIQDLPLAIIFSVYIALIMCVPLLIGDSTTRDNYGKTMSFSYLLIGLGVLIGMILMISIPNIIDNNILADNLITGTIFMACIFCFIFLLNMRETLPSKEQEWKKFLIHMYIIHNSGILLYEHRFIKESPDTKKKDVSADLKAGGIIGVKNILKEIVRGEKEIRTIDHGDRLLILKLNSTGNVVFALVVKDESIVIRKKLDSIMEEFDKSYSQFTDDVNLGGLDMRIFNPIKFLARKYFGT